MEVIMNKLLFLSGFVALMACFINAPAVQVSIPDGWRKVDAEGHFTFYLPESMKLSSDARCVECAWGSTYSDGRIQLYAEYTSWNEEYAAHHLAKQKEYVKELTEVDGRKAKIQSWRAGDLPGGFGHIAEVRFYGVDGKLVARMSALCKERRDVEIAKQVFRTVDFPQ
jgi:hypothetical protein